MNTENLSQAFQQSSLEDRLALVAEKFPHAVFTTSLGKEDQVITDAIARSKSGIRIVTLQTGRLFQETLDLLEETRNTYSISIEEIHPRQDAINSYAAKYGMNGFYESIEARHACCHARKVEPLQRSLEGADAWITGMRREQSDNRSEVPFAEYSDSHGLMKFNPLADWSISEIDKAIQDRQIPINPLHARNYPSIGCDPCTRAIKPGEPERAGRWWWEQEQARECGLHVS